MADQLPGDVLRVIGSKLDTAGDRIRFRAVSKSWSSTLPFRQPPVLITFSFGRRFIKAISGGENFLYKNDVGFWGAKISAESVVGCIGDWFIIKELVPMYYDLLSIQDNRFTSNLLFSNPFSKHHFYLPSCSQLNHPCFSWLHKVVFSSAPNGVDSDFTAAALWDPSKLTILRPRADSWADCRNTMDGGGLAYFDDVVFYRGRFYVITTKGELLVCHISEDPLKLSFVSDYFTYEKKLGLGLGRRKHYLLESFGELLMVVIYFDIPVHDPLASKWETKSFKTYKFDFASIKFDELKCLGDHSLFLGYNTCASVSASDYFGLVRRNCIHFIDDLNEFTMGEDNMLEGPMFLRRHTEHDVKEFHLEDNSITPHIRGASTSQCFSPAWIIPTN